MRRAAIILLALPACAIDAGHGFATIESASIEVKLVPGAARELGNNTVLTNLGYHVALESASLILEGAELQSLETGAQNSGGAFDPANPPPGYSLCHSGHCHHESGRLVPYAEVQAGGSTTTSYQKVVALPFMKTFDLLRGEALALEELDPSRELPKTNLARATILVHSLALRGRVRAGPEMIDAPFEADVELESALFQTLTTAIDRDGPEAINLELEVELQGDLFDDLPFAALIDQQAVVLTATAAETLAAHVLATQPQVSLEKGN